jgi:Asp/Glu/hydantoin racemase
MDTNVAIHGQFSPFVPEHRRLNIGSSPMPRRIFLVHPTPLVLAPIDEAFKTLWPQAQTLNLLDESLYADIPQDGALSDAIYARVATLLRHCEQSGADGILFSGTTFGPAVDAARAQLRVPVLRAEEAVMDQAVTRGERILLVCTAKRAMPVVRATLDAAAARAGVKREISELWVAGARDAILGGDMTTHDRLIAQEVAGAGDFDVIVFGQISMVPARVPLPAAIARRIVTGLEATVARMRALVE